MALKGLQDLPKHDPLRLYSDEMEKDQLSDPSAGEEGWTWTDDCIDDDFNSLKKPTESLTQTISALQAFFLMYLGEVSTTVNLGGLYCQILATSPNFTSESTNLIQFNPEGKVELVSYTPFSSLTQAVKNFLAAKITEEDYNQAGSDMIPPPIEKVDAKLVGDVTGGPSFEGREEQNLVTDIPSVREADMVEFKRAIQEHLKILTPPADGKTMGTEPARALRSLHLTATFLILILLRRITKRESDLINAFSRTNLHRHYYEMVPDPLGITLPPPSATVNRATGGAVSINLEAGRHIGTMLLYLMKSCTATENDKPVGLLGQERLGLEAILKATCMTHIAGSGLPLITLFVALKAVFEKTEKEALEWMAFSEVNHSVLRIAKLRLKQRALAKDGKQTKLFPYCRLVHQKYHQNLGFRGNQELCYLMACLIDLKNPPISGTGGAKAALWTSNMNSELRREIEEAARAQFGTTNTFTLTARFGGQVSYHPGAAKPGTTWTGPAVRSDTEAEIETATSVDEWVE